MTLQPPGPPPDRPPATWLEQAARHTYRYLRLAIVGLVVLLAVSVILEAAQCGGPLNSISASYYTPARSVFVGSLIGIGAALIAIRGREGPENALLNIAGMSAGLIALVPTPRPGFTGTCGSALSTAPSPALSPALSSALSDLRAGVQNNVWALLAAGLFGLLAAAVSIATSRHRGWWTLAIATALWIAVLLWFVLARPSFTDAAHYAASALLFVLVTAVAVINAIRARYQPHPPLVPAAVYRAVYWSVAAVMAGAMISAGVLWFGRWIPAAAPGGWMLWIEGILVAAFAAFWLAQTAQFWNTGVPEPAGRPSPEGVRADDR